MRTVSFFQRLRKTSVKFDQTRITRTFKESRAGLQPQKKYDCNEFVILQRVLRLSFWICYIIHTCLLMSYCYTHYILVTRLLWLLHQHNGTLIILLRRWTYKWRKYKPEECTQCYQQRILTLLVFAKNIRLITTCFHLIYKIQKNAHHMSPMWCLQRTYFSQPKV